MSRLRRRCRIAAASGRCAGRHWPGSAALRCLPRARAAGTRRSSGVVLLGVLLSAVLVAIVAGVVSLHQDHRRRRGPTAPTMVWQESGQDSEPRPGRSRGTGQDRHRAQPETAAGPRRIPWAPTSRSSVTTSSFPRMQANALMKDSGTGPAGLGAQGVRQERRQAGHQGGRRPHLHPWSGISMSRRTWCSWRDAHSASVLVPASTLRSPILRKGRPVERAQERHVLPAAQGRQGRTSRRWSAWRTR